MRQNITETYTMQDEDHIPETYSLSGFIPENVATEFNYKLSL